MLDLETLAARIPASTTNNNILSSKPTTSTKATIINTPFNQNPTNPASTISFNSVPSSFSSLQPANLSMEEDDRDNLQHHIDADDLD